MVRFIIRGRKNLEEAIELGWNFESEFREILLGPLGVKDSHSSTPHCTIPLDPGINTRNQSLVYTRIPGCRPGYEKPLLAD